MDIDRSLSENWRRLGIEAGEQSDSIARSYRDIIDGMPLEPSSDQLNQMLNELKRLLGPYEYGRRLFDVITALVGDESETWERRESFPEKRDLLRTLGEEDREEIKTREAT